MKNENEKTMKRALAKEFFTVLWSGLFQALGWFFGLFGYKRDGKYAKCVWALFATSVAVVMAIIAIILGYIAYDLAGEWYNKNSITVITLTALRIRT